MAVQKFEDLLVWQKSQDLSVAIYNIFSENRDFSFRDQIKNATWFNKVYKKVIKLKNQLLTAS